MEALDFRHLKLWGLTGLGFSLTDLTCPRPRPFRLACSLVLQSEFAGCLCLLGVACATWVGISRGSTFRDVFLPMGHPHSLAVYRANKAVARLGLIKDLVYISIYLKVLIAIPHDNRTSASYTL